jgi:phosphoesterase RecJ-like protein
MRIPTKIRTPILDAQKILLIAHVAPDGDAIGSLLGLGLGLAKIGKGVTMTCEDPAPRQLGFLPGVDRMRRTPTGEEDLILALDSSDTERLGTLYDADLFSSRPVLNIDHHVTNIEYGDVNWVEPAAASTAQMCAMLVEALDIPWDTEIATCLLTGVVTDTRCFRTSNTTPDVLRAATLLMENGASLSDVTDAVFQHNSPSRICLWGKALSAAQMANRIVWTNVSQEMLDDCGATPFDDEGLANFLDATHDIDVAIVFREKEPEQIEVSMRAARGVDISGVALSMGGGGHPQAAGCSCTGNLEEIQERVLSAVKGALEAQERL